MKTRVKVILITFFALMLLVFGLVFAINQKKQSVKYFSDSGYIMGNIYETEGDIQTVYFNENSAYKKHSDEELKITDTDGKKIIVNKENFVHYSNSSIMALKDGVAIDLDNIDSKLLKYYNVFSYATLQKTNQGYEIKNIDEIITFNKLMFKISENKYLIAADNIIAYFSENQTINFKEFVEIEYVNEDVIRIYNNEYDYQSIASNLFLLIDNIKIDLEYKTIEKNKIQYLTMANLVINSNDNIEVLPQKEEIIDSDQTKNNTSSSENNNNNNNNAQNPTNNAQNGTQNNIDTSILEGLTPIDPDETVKEENVIQPKFTVESLDATMLGFENLKITMVDESGIIYGDSVVEIIENSTGKKVASLANWLDGNTNYSITSYSNLKPDTEYTLTVTGQYEIDGTIYDRVYVSKIFRTLDIGLEVILDCATSDSLSFAIYKTDYSNIESITYDVLDSDNQSVLNEPKKLNYVSGNYVIAYADGLISNSKYRLVIKNIQYGDDVMSTDNVSSLQIAYSMKTLKQRPDLDVKLNAEVNTLKNQLVLSIENIKDVNKGIKNYTYKLYLNDGAISNQKEPIYVVTKEDSSPVTIDIVEPLVQGGSYYFDVELEFDDNEKTIIYNTQYSDPVSTSDIVYPKVVNYVSSENVICEELIGLLNIDDSDGFIKYNNINQYQIVLREKGNALSTSTSDKTIEIDGSLNGEYISLPVEFKNLKPNTEYILYTYLKKDNKSIYIGYVTAKTTETDALYLIMKNKDDEESISSNLFEVTMDLDDRYFDENDYQMSNIYSYIKDNLNYITLDLYGCNKNQCFPLKFEKSVSSANNSEELGLLIQGNELLIDSSDFGFYAEDYNASYDTYKVYLNAYSISNFEIPIYINDEKTNYFELKIIDNIPTVDVKVTEIINADTDSERYNSSLNETTIVGFNFELKETYSTKGIGIQNFIYEIYEGKCDNLENLVTTGTKALNETVSKDHSLKIYFEDYNMKRGLNYCLVYDSNFISEDGEEKKSNNGKLDIVAERQSAKITGSLVKYEETFVTFRLKINDIDSEIQRLYLKADNNESIPANILKECKNTYCDYKFEILKLNNLTKFGLYAELQKTVESELENPIIYEFALKDLKPLVNPISLNVVNENGKLKFTLDDLGVDIFGLKIIGFDQEGNHLERYLNFEKKELVEEENSGIGILESTNAKTEYVATINNANLGDYGITKNGYYINLENVKMQLIYSDGSIDLDTSDLVGIRQANINLNTSLHYYNAYPNNSLFEDKTSLNSIFYKETLKNFITETNFIIKDLTYVSSDIENNTIGQTLASNLVHLYKISLKDLVLDKTSVIVDTVLLTNNKVTYTSTGAYIDFEIKDDDIFGKLNTVKFDLTCGGDSESIGWVWNNENGIWEYPNGTTHIESIDKKQQNLISVRVKDINDYEKCEYVLSYTKDGSDAQLISKNEENNKDNKDIITSLKSLDINNKSMGYETKYWEKIDEDLGFVKNLKYDFEIIENYILEENETLYYDVIIKDDALNELTILGKQRVDSVSVSNLVNLYNKIADGDIVSNSYNVIIKPYIFNSEIEKTYSLLNFEYDNKLIIETKLPSYSALSYQDVIYLTVNDKDGIFAEWNNSDMPSGVNLEELTDNSVETIYNNKKYYFELLSSDRVIAYKPMSFITQTQTISLKDLFGTVLKNGTYGSRICYYSILNDEKSCTSTLDIKLMSSNVLNASIMKLSKSFLLDFDNPDEAVKDNISSVSYTLLYNDGTIVTKKLEDLTFITRVGSEGGKSYFIELPVGILTSNVKQLEVKILDRDDLEITTILYK